MLYNIQKLNWKGDILKDKNFAIKIKLFDGCKSLYNVGEDHDWWYNLQLIYDISYYSYKGDSFKTDWFCRQKYIPFEYVEEIWVNKQPLYTDGIKYLSDEYESLFYIDFNLCEKLGINYHEVKEDNKTVYEKRKFLNNN